MLTALKAFSKCSDPGCSQLKAQHHLDAVKRTSVPEAKSCLNNLTRLAFSLLSGTIDNAIAPRLTDAPLTALHKNSGRYRPIAIGKYLSFSQLSELCCSKVPATTCFHSIQSSWCRCDRRHGSLCSYCKILCRS